MNTIRFEEHVYFNQKNLEENHKQRQSSGKVNNKYKLKCYYQK